MKSNENSLEDLKDAREAAGNLVVFLFEVISFVALVAAMVAAGMCL